MASAQDASAGDTTVSLLLTGGRVLSGFRASLFAAAARAGVSVNEFVLRAAGETGEFLGTDSVGKWVRQKRAEAEASSTADSRINGAFGNDLAPKGDRLKPSDPDRRKDDAVDKAADNKPKGTTSDPVVVDVKSGRIRGGWVSC
jgi:hypothetical protein